MDELRKDPTRGQWSLIRPKGPATADSGCRYCPGAEHLGGREIAAYRKDGSLANEPGWTIRGRHFSQWVGDVAVAAGLAVIGLVEVLRLLGAPEAQYDWTRLMIGIGAVVVAALGLAGLAVAADAQQPAPPPPVVQPPADNVFPIPVPHEVTFSDSWHACRGDGCSRQHKGNDLMADEGVPVVAVESGTIARASHDDRGLGGVTVWLLGDSGVAYYYAHNAQNLVAEGQRRGLGGGRQ